MVDTTIYIQQLLLKIRKQDEKIKSLCAENAHLHLQNSILRQDLEKHQHEEQQQLH